VELCEKIFGQLQRAIVLLVGAGKVGEMTLERLAERGAQEIRLINRSPQRAHRLSDGRELPVRPFEELQEQLCQADIVITSTGAPAAFVTRELIATTMKARHYRPLCIVDLGVPRNVEPAVGDLEHVYRFDIDDLQGVIQQHEHARRQAAGAALSVVDRKVGQFLSWWSREWPEAAAIRGVAAPAGVPMLAADAR
jgi:glutamyl-tRNA reductase